MAVRRALADIGSDLETWRKLRGLTQIQLADRAGVERKTIRRLESGDGAVSSELALRVVYALGLLGPITAAFDPYGTDVGRLRADEQLPERVRPRQLS